MNVQETRQPEPLDPLLLPYLDWPVWLREDGVTCERDDCQHEDCQDAGWGPVQVSESGHTTLRAILAGLKKHAGATPVSTPACKGKAFEHHERTEVDENDEGVHLLWRWRCPVCGDSGSLDALKDRLIALVPALYRLKEQMLDRDAVFLLPSDATPGEMGQFYGRPLFRVQGIDRPLIALGVEVLSRLSGPKIEIAP